MTRGGESIAHRLRELPLRTKIVITVIVDVLMLEGLVLAAYAMRVSSLEVPTSATLHLYLLAPILSVVLAMLFGVYNASARHFTFNLERRIVLSQFLVPAFWAIILLATGTQGFARSTLFIYLVLSIGGMIILRRSASWFFAGSSAERVIRREQVPVVIFGAGQQGLAVMDFLRNNGRFRPVAFLDTDYTLVNRVVGGFRVYSTEQLSKIIEKYQPQELIIAKRIESRVHKRELVDKAIDRGLRVKTVPSLDEIVAGKLSFTDVRPVRVDDLLGRDPVPPDLKLMNSIISGKVVMITGAGGSIGSELVRQCLALKPKHLILVDHSEFSLFEIHRKVENNFSDAAPVELEAVLIDVQDFARVDALVRRTRPDIIFHAAAYKHVRMVQENVNVGIRNNIAGTRSVAEAARRWNVGRFVLISTDKAVRPTSVMGASKRVAEMFVQAIAAEKGGKTVFSIVRFGNVLASTGSVVPLFAEQIEAGGPVLVTHPDVTRYFMLITEAAQLVIQAAAMAEGGDVFVLDMGEPVKILQLAKTMIELAGMSVRTPEQPDGDIEIKFIGLRDGEKLYEELQIGRDIMSTSHPRIVRSHEVFLPLKRLDKELTALLDDAGELAVEKVKSRLFRLAQYGN